MESRKVVFALVALVSFLPRPLHAQPAHPCGLLTAEFPQPGNNLYSIEDDIGLGRERLAGIEMGLSMRLYRPMQVYQQKEVSEYVDGLLKRILAEAPGYTNQFTYRVYFYDEITPNAQAVAGGYIAMSLGMIINAPSDDYLAFVLTHEIGHAALRHPTRMATLEQLYIVEDRLLYEKLKPLAIPPLSDFERTHIIALKEETWSRAKLLDRDEAAHELEADHFSAIVGVRAGFNPKGIIAKLQEQGRGQERGWIDTERSPNGFLRSLMYACQPQEITRPERISPELLTAKEIAEKLLTKR